MPTLKNFWKQNNHIKVNEYTWWIFLQYFEKGDNFLSDLFTFQ